MPKSKPRLLLFALPVIIIIISLSNYALAVNTSVSYNFKSQIALEKIYSSKNVYTGIVTELKKLNEKNSTLTDMFSAGHSLDGREILVFRVGTGHQKILIDAEHHSREYITSILTLNQIEYLIYAYNNNLTIAGQNVKSLLDSVSIWFMPMINPDGMELCTRGTASIRNKDLLKNIPYQKSYESLKDNIRGVNLNRNYDVEWGKSKDISTKAFSSRYPGQKSFSEPEAQALKNLCLQYDFDLNITYHAAGQILYWYYNQTGNDITRDYNIAKTLCSTTGYTMISKTQSLKDPSRGGGSREWFVYKFKKPAFTIEVAKGALTKPVKFSEYPTVWNQNKSIPIIAANSIKSTKNTINNSKIKVVYNNTLLAQEELEPVRYNNSATLLPINQIAKKLGLKVSSAAQSKEIILEKENTSIKMNLDSSIISVNGDTIILTSPIIEIGGKVYIPCDLLSAAIGLNIRENISFNTLYIDSP